MIAACEHVFKFGGEGAGATIVVRFGEPVSPTEAS